MSLGPPPPGAKLLPPNATKLERALADTIEHGGPLPVPLRELWDPWACPLHLLPWLGWALSVDIWDDTWPEVKKRHVVATSLQRAQRKGTPASVYEYVNIAGGRVAKITVPPAKMFLMPKLTVAERQRFLDLMPQLRVYPYRDRGVAHGGAFTASLRVNDRDRMFLAQRPILAPGLRTEDGLNGSGPITTEAAEPLLVEPQAIPVGALLLDDESDVWLDEETGEPILDEEAPIWAEDTKRWSECYAFPTDAPLRWGRRTFYWDYGVEQECRRLEVTKTGEDGKTAYDFETTFIPARSPYTLFPGEEETGGRLRGKMFLQPSDAVSRTVSTRVQREYNDPGNEHLSLKAIPLGNQFDPVEIRPQGVAQKATAKGGFFPGGKGSGLHCIGAYMPITTAGDRLFERLYLHDPERLPEKRPRTTHLGYVRLGMPAYNAEVQVETPGKRSIWAGGEFIGGFHVASDAPKRVARMADAVRLSKGVRDKILIDTKAFRPVQISDRIRVGSLVVGGIIRR